MKVYVEGGGTGKDLRALCRQGFSAFIRKAGCAGRMPSVVACGGRNDAFDDFCMALVNGEDAVLLVDSEEAVRAAYQKGADATKWRAWDFLRDHDGWDVAANLERLAKRHGRKIPKAADLQAHLMVRCMESWLVADSASLARFFGAGFSVDALPQPSVPVEGISKQEVFAALAKATRKTKTKGRYSKGGHSFAILSLIAPESVWERSPWARRFVNYLKKET